MKSKLQQLIAEANNEHKDTLDAYTLANSQWTQKDIEHYLTTEKDPIRRARWCQLYLQLEL